MTINLKLQMDNNDNQSKTAKNLPLKHIREHSLDDENTYDTEIFKYGANTSHVHCQPIVLLTVGHMMY